MRLFILIFVFLCGPIGWTKTISVHGHRGARAFRPENTISAFKYALEVGVDVLEMDLGVTKDGVLILQHDPYIDNTICLDGKKKIKSQIPVASLSLEEIKKMDCGSLINPKFKTQVLQPGEKIPTLKEVFEFVKASDIDTAKKVEFNIETKIVPTEPELTPSPKKFAELLVNEIRRAGMVERSIVQSFDHRTLYWVKKLEPKIRTSQLTGGSMVDLVAAAKGIRRNLSRLIDGLVKIWCRGCTRKYSSGTMDG
ncbi:MAG: glycerophosphodiester phosphodiesterase family protein [Bdellovibrionales bacterium]